MSNRLEMAGLKFGLLDVVSYASTIKKKAFWNCRCACGTSVTVVGADLRNGHTRSCGCILREKRPDLVTHGMSSSRPYKIWQLMKNRCLNELSKDFQHYGGRGIRLDAGWAQAFENFWGDMKRGYAKHLTIERKNNNGGYNKRNCRWATRKEQSHNTRHNRIVTVSGVSMLAVEAAKIAGVAPGTMTHRIQNWPADRLLDPH